METDHTNSTSSLEAEESGTRQLLLRLSQNKTILPQPHIFNSDCHSSVTRYGIPAFLVATFALLLASDIGVGASAHVEISTNGNVTSSNTLGEISVFSSVGKLWENDAYALAILIACTSISWPYVKLAMTFYAWVTPFDIGCRRHAESNPSVFVAEREKLLFWLDILGKFSFVDTFVLVILMVVFRATISVLWVTTEVWVQPRWGMYGFIVASILSLLGTQCVLHVHRAVQQKLERDGHNHTLHSWEGSQAIVSQSGMSPIITSFALLLSMALLIIGAKVETFKFKYSGLSSYETSYSLISIGSNIPKMARDPDGVLIHLLQAFYFILTMGIPILSCWIYALLLFVEANAVWARRIFVMAEMALSWGATDVYFLSSIFAVAQIPNFARQLVEEKCKSCFNIEAEIDPLFALTCAGALFHFAIGLWVVKKAQTALYAVESVKLCQLCCNQNSSISAVI